VYNSGKKKNERISRLYEIFADKKMQIEAVDAGNIIAVAGLSNVHTGDTISDTEFPIILESITFSEPVISISIEPKSNKDLDKLSISLSKLTEEDPTFKVKTDSNTGQIILSGMGELHLEIIIDRLLRDFNVECNQGIPKVNYKETITTSVEHHEILKKQTGGHGMFAEIKFRIESSDSEGLIFINEVKGGNIPKEFINAIEKGIKDSLPNGCLAGFEIYGIKCTIFDGSYHIVDSNTTSFEICAKEGFKKALLKSNPVLMEPIMDEEIETPEEYMGDVISDLHKRRSRIVKIEDKFGIKIISAKSPLANKFGYITTLRNISSGHAISNLTFSHYEKLSESLTNEIVKSIK
jgi:elongation factor G